MTLCKSDMAGVAIAWGDPGGLCEPPEGSSVGVASDLWLGPGDDAGAARIVRRVAVDAEDQGRVYRPDGIQVGRVISLEGRLLHWCLCSERAPACEHACAKGGAAGGTA